MTDFPKIIESTVNPIVAKLKLDNGIEIGVTSNYGHVHIQFSGLNGKDLVCGPFSGRLEGDDLMLRLSNYVNIHY